MNILKPTWLSLWLYFKRNKYERGERREEKRERKERRQKRRERDERRREKEWEKEKGDTKKVGERERERGKGGSFSKVINTGQQLWEWSDIK